MSSKKSKSQKIAGFNASGVGVANNQFFGLPFSYEDAELVLVQIPWEVTVSYRAGTANGPEAILDATTQIDLHDADFPNGWHQGIFTKKISAGLKKKNTELRKKAEQHIKSLEKGKKNDQADLLSVVNLACEQLNTFVHHETSAVLDENKIVGLVGGDHSTPLGFMKALAEKHGGFGILQIDAHADLRNAYEGFTYSHASIMFNALQIKELTKLVQVGVRDICDDEIEVIDHSERRIITFFNQELKSAAYNNISWGQICRQIVEHLPKKVYISFDIDGLDPKLCPDTGTPVPGGLEFEQAVHLLNEIVESGRQIIGFDIVEVAPGKNEWNAIVGARMLYKLCNLTLKSNQ